MPGMGTSSNTKDMSQRTAESGNTASTSTGTQTQQQQQNQQQTSNSTIGPWQATQPLLSNIISSLNGISTAPNAGQSDALAAMQTGASEIPNFGNAATGAVGNFLGGKYGGMLGGAVSDYGAGMSPYLSSSYLNPMSTPGLSDALGTMKNDITNSINDQFAAAGRDLSPGNTTALARGLSQGMAPMIANQYNQNVGVQRNAQDALFGAKAAAPGMLAGFDTAGIGLAGAVPGLYTAPGAAQLGAANTAFAQPMQNVGMLEGLVNPIAGLGQSTSGTTTGTGTGTTTGTTANNMTGNYSGTGMLNGHMEGTNTASPLDQMSKWLGILPGFGKMLGGIPSFGGGSG